MPNNEVILRCGERCPHNLELENETNANSTQCQFNALPVSYSDTHIRKIKQYSDTKS